MWPASLRRVAGYVCIFTVASLFTASGYIGKSLISTGVHPVGQIFYSFYQLSHNTVLVLVPGLIAWSRKRVGLFADMRKHITIKQVLIFATMRITSLLLYNLGLPLIPMSTSALLSASNPVFTFLFSVACFDRTRCAAFPWKPPLGVGCAIAGTVLALFSRMRQQEARPSSDAPENVWLGGALILGSCGVCSFASCLLSKWLTDERYVNDVLGLLGCLAALASVPVVSLCHVLSLEKFHLPNSKILLIMSGNALLGNVATNFFMAVAVVILGPVIVTVGLTAQVGLATVVDALRGDIQFGGLDIASILCILAAVGLVAGGAKSAKTCPPPEEVLQS